MTHLFSKIVLQDALRNISLPDLAEKVSILQEWNEMYKRWELQKKKETAFEATYSEKLFWTILGYSDVNGGIYTREKHPKNISNGQTCDIGLWYYAADRNDTLAVVELKDAGTSINRPQQREGNMTPIQQGFKYKPLYNSRWVIVSNYYEFRLYRDTYQDYEVWTLADLTNPDNDYEQFRIFHLLLHAESLIAENGESTTEKLLAKVRIEQEMITKKFYKEYSWLREELMRDIWKHNPTFRNESVVTLTQRIIDRIVFVHFCEDRGLLPQNKLAENLTRAKEIDLTPWEVLMLYFRGIDKWSDKLGIPDGYNGGLFRDEDDTIKNLKVSDEIITKFIELGRYDFSDEGGQLSVEILGHIFEQSISDLEDIRTKIQKQGQDSTDEKQDEKKVSKRKKDGIFYTPAYIVDYIVRNSLGKYLEEHEERIKESYKLKGDITEKSYRKREIEAYTEYQTVLHNVKVLDPACGSGAFLVRVFDFLLAENKRVANILTEWVQSDLFQSDMYFREILKYNIYGVDLNEESVEITKLSLWLKSAVRGKKLETLDNNIKCGNSLIDDPAVAGDKAFNWNTEFTDIMASGGFDVIVGNPPYVRQELLWVKQKGYFSKKYKNVYNSIADLYIYFFEIWISVLSQNWYLCYITPNKWMERKYGTEFRRFIKKLNIQTIVNYGELKIFDDAATEPAIISIKNENSNNKIYYSSVKNLIQAKNVQYTFWSFSKDLLRDDIWKFLDTKTQSILDKFNNSDTTLWKYTKNWLYYWIKTWLNEAFIIWQNLYKKILSQDIKSKEIMKSMVEGDDFNWWSIHRSDRYIVATWFDIDIEHAYPAIFQYLSNFKDKLIKRDDKWKNWWNLRSCDYYDKLEKPKIIYYHTAVKHSFYYDKEWYYISANCYFIANSDQYLQCILNSSLFNFVKKYLFPAFGDSENGGRVRLDANKMINLPIMEIEDEKKNIFYHIADSMTLLNNNFFNISTIFLKNIQAKYTVEKVTRKLEKWWELDFAGFIKELKIKISLTEQEELMTYFETRKKELLEIEGQIRKTDADIDEMVFDLYGLTEEERGIVINS